ncbi:hypothetical protein ABNX05_11490 [Lysinibacillus sp. M3]|uniref:Uncharacterized protein n=1 Tax=Lysinibacillus zambalensis TaxID=3160866 RepID=A0ABV1MRV8_9BACI
MEVVLNSSNIPYYEDLGYEIPRWRRSTKRSKTDLTVRKGTKIIVDIKHIPKGSHIKVDVQCDYCGEILHKPYYKYISQNENSTIKKDSCNSCKGKKTSEYMKLVHGVNHNSQLCSFRESVSDKNRTDSSEVLSSFNKLNYTMLSEYVRYAEPIEFICNKHECLGIQITSYNIVKNFQSGCKACRYEKISGENYYNWQGGVTNIYNYLRGKLGKWRKDSLDNTNYRCLLTNSEENLVVHHPYNFHNIVHEALNCLNLKVHENLDDYSDDDLSKLTSTCLELHNKYGLGLVICKSLHNKFHAIYGNKNNTYDQFKEFKNNYINGEFREVV